MEYSGWGSSWATMARPMAMMSGDDAVDALGGLVLGGLEVAGGVLGDGDVGGHPAGHRVAAMRELAGDDQLLELAGGRRHGAEALAELDHRGALVLQAQRDVGGVPGVVGDLLDLEQGSIGEDALLDRAVVDDVARRRLDEALPGPEIVGHAVALGALAEVLLGHEVARQHMPEAIVLLGREHPGERGDVGGGREVEAAEAGPAAQLLEVDRTVAGIPGGEVDPALGLLGPLVEVHAPEGVLGAGQGDRLLGLARQVVLLDREAEARVGLAPDFWDRSSRRPRRRRR